MKTLLLVGFFFLPLQTIFATPKCLRNDQVLGVNNKQVIAWKNSTPVDFKERGHIQGQIAKIYPDYGNHVHISVQIGEEEEDSIEVIFQYRYGSSQDLRIGDRVEACGDYATKGHRRGDPSTDRAILHWVHLNERTPDHPHGYLIINGKDLQN